MVEIKVENTISCSQFRAFILEYLKKRGMKIGALSRFLGLKYATFNNFLNGTALSLSKMESVAAALGIGLPELLIEGRALLAGEAPPLAQIPTETAPEAPQSDDRAPATLPMERENELLRQIAHQAAVAIQKDELLMEKDKIIAALVAALREEGLEVPPRIKKLCQEAAAIPFTEL